MKILGEGVFDLNKLIGELYRGTDKSTASIFKIFKIGKKFDKLPRGICGRSRNSTSLVVTDTVELEMSLHFENVRIEGKEPNSRILIKGGRITFENVCFESVSIEAVKDAYVFFSGCVFKKTDLPIIGKDNARIKIDGGEIFRYIKGRKVKLCDKAMLLNAKELMHPLKLDPLTVLQSLSFETLTAVPYIEVTEPIIIEEDTEIGNPKTPIVIKLKTAPAIIVQNGISLKLKNIFIEGSVHREKDRYPLIYLEPKSHLEIIDCHINNGETAFLLKNAHLSISGSEIKNFRDYAIKCADSSVLEMKNSNVAGCKGFIYSEYSSHISIVDSIINNCETPVFNINSGSKLIIKSTQIKEFKGSNYCINMDESTAYLERIHLSSMREGAGGIYASNMSKIKIINSVIKNIDSHCLSMHNNTVGEIIKCNLVGNSRRSGSHAQIWLKASRANVLNTNIERSPAGNGIAVTDWAKIYIANSKIANNKGFGIFVDKTSSITGENIKTEGNRKGLLSEIGAKVQLEAGCIIKDEIQEEIPVNLNKK